MDENLHNIDDLFRKAVDRHEEMPSPGLWENIDKRLDKKKVISISEKYRKLKWVAAALLVFSAGMAMYTIRTRLKNRELDRLNSMSHKKLSKKDIGINGDKNIVIEKTPAGKAADKRAATDTSIVTQTDTVAANTVSNEPMAKTTKQQKKEETSRKISKQTVGSDMAEQSMKPAKNRVKNSKISEAALAGNKENETEKPAEKETKSVVGADKSINKGSDKPADNSDAVMNEKDIGDLSVVTEQKKGLLSIPPPDLSFENAFKNANPFKDMLSENGKNASGTGKIKGVKRYLFSATVFYSPDFVATTVDNGHRRFREDDRDEIKSKEEVKKASSLGVLVDYNLSNRFTIESGIAFSGMTTSIQPKTIYARPDERGQVNYRFNCSAGYSFIPLKAATAPAPGDSVTALSSTNTLQYASVPLTLKYVLGKGKFSLKPAVGIAVNFLTKGKIETEIAGSAGNEKANINHIEGLNKSYMSGLVSLGAEYNLNKRMALSFTPVSRLALSAINKNAPVKTYLNSFGLVTGLVIKL